MAQLSIATDAALLCHVVERAAVTDVIANTDALVPAVSGLVDPRLLTIATFAAEEDFSALQCQIMIET
jgi:hypothetical protein